MGLAALQPSSWPASQVLLQAHSNRRAVASCELCSRSQPASKPCKAELRRAEAAGRPCRRRHAYVAALTSAPHPPVSARSSLPAVVTPATTVEAQPALYPGRYRLQLAPIPLPCARKGARCMYLAYAAMGSSGQREQQPAACCAYMLPALCASAGNFPARMLAYLPACLPCAYAHKLLACSC